MRFQQAATRFKQIATLIVPLGEQSVTLDTAHNLLDEWHDSLAARTSTVARYLALRLGFLLGSVAVVLIISEVWRRATFRFGWPRRRIRYTRNRPAIELQHAALQRFIDFQTALPGPEVYARLNVKGLECTVRYPVEPAQAAATDQKMLQALREAQAKAPERQIVDGPLSDTAEN